MTNKILAILLLCSLSHAQAYESPSLSYKAPTDWSESTKMFGSEAIFMAPIVYKKEPLMLILNTYSKSLGMKDIHKFIDQDLQKEFASNHYKKLEQGTLPLDRGKLEFVKGQLLEDEVENYIYVGIINRPDKYHYFMFEAPKKEYDASISSIEASLKRIKLK